MGWAPSERYTASAPAFWLPVCDGSWCCLPRMTPQVKEACHWPSALSALPSTPTSPWICLFTSSRSECLHVLLFSVELIPGFSCQEMVAWVSSYHKPAWRPIGLVVTPVTLYFFEKVVRATPSNKACSALQCLLVGQVKSSVPVTTALSVLISLPTSCTQLRCVTMWVSGQADSK